MRFPLASPLQSDKAECGEVNALGPVSLTGRLIAGGGESISGRKLECSP